MEFTGNNNSGFLAAQSAAVRKVTALHEKLNPKPIRVLLEQQELLKELTMPAQLAALNMNLNTIRKAGIDLDSSFKSSALFEALGIMNKQWDKLNSELLQMGFSREVNEIFDTPFEELEAEEYLLDQEELSSEKTELIQTIPGIIQDIYRNHDLLDNLDPLRFEQIIAEILSSHDYKVELTKQTRDGGYDILALKYCGVSEFKTLVECKRWKDKVGVGVIRSFCGVMSVEKPNKGLIVTTSYFTKDAVARKLQEGSLLDLADRDKLLNWVRQYSESTFK